MKTQTTKAIRVIVPTLLGAAAVATALWFESILHGYFVTPDPLSDTPPPIGFVFYILSLSPVILLALAFQAYFAIPYWNKAKSSIKGSSPGIWLAAAIMAIIGGLLFGLLFWSSELGWTDFVQASLIGTALLIIYWTANLLTMSYIDKNTNGT